MNTWFNGQVYFFHGHNFKTGVYYPDKITTAHGDDVTELVNASEFLRLEFLRLAQIAFNQMYPDG